MGDDAVTPTFACPECGTVLSVMTTGGNGEMAQSGATLAQPGATVPNLRQDARKVFSSKALNPNPSTREELPYTPDFELFWKVYPLRKDKRKAAQAWRKATQRADANDIIDGAKRYRDDPNRDDRYTKYPASFLNADAWADEDVLPAKTAPEPEHPIYAKMRIEREIAEMLGE